MSDSPDADNEVALARLKRAMSSHHGFQLILLEVAEGPTRNQVLDKIMAWSGLEGVPRLLRMRARGSLEVVPKLRSKSGGILLDDIDSALFDDVTVDRLVGTLNWQRDQLRRRIAGPLILAISARGVARLFERAPDLVNWRSHTCRITPSANEPSLAVRMESILDAIEPDLIELELLDAHLAMLTREDLPAEYLGKTWIRAGLAYMRCGSLDHARKAYGRASTIAMRDGEAYVEALMRLTALDFLEGKGAEAQRRMLELEPLVAHVEGAASQPLWLSLRADRAWVNGEVQTSVSLRRQSVTAAADDDALHSSMQLVLAVSLHAAGLNEDAQVELAVLRENAEAEFRVKACDLAAKIEYERGRVDLAVKLLRDGLRTASTELSLRHDYLSLAMKLAGIMISIGEYAEAQKIFRDIRPFLKRASAEVRTEAALGEGIVALQAGRQTATKALEEAVALAPSSSAKAWALLLLSLARAAQDDREGAEQAARSGWQTAQASGDHELILGFQPLLDELLPMEAGSKKPAAGTSKPPPSKREHRRNRRRRPSSRAQ
jgi:tetratricopeptide (TPR) repeat protein